MFDVNGAAGGPGQIDATTSTNSQGGLGGTFPAMFAVTPDEVLTISVGCQGLAIRRNGLGFQQGLVAPATGSVVAVASWGTLAAVAAAGPRSKRGSTVLVAAGGGGGGGAGFTPDQVSGGGGGGANQGGGEGTTFSPNCPTPGVGASTTVAGTGGTGTPGHNGLSGDGPSGGSGTVVMPDSFRTASGVVVAEAGSSVVVLAAPTTPANHAAAVVADQASPTLRRPT